MTTQHGFQRHDRLPDDGTGGGDSTADFAEREYERLRAIAAAYMRKERPDHTLSATALANEAILGLLRANVRWRGRESFLAAAAKAMRHTLVDYARARLRAKRRGDRTQVPLDEVLMEAFSPQSLGLGEFLDLNALIDELAESDPRSARVVELRFFVGLTADEIAEALDISAMTVRRDFKTAKAWLTEKLRSTDGDRRSE